MRSSDVLSILSMRLLLFLLIWSAILGGQAHSAEVSLPPNCRQMVLVTTADWSQYEASLQRFARDAEGAWSRVGAPMNAQVGSNGLAPGIGLLRVPFGERTAKREGDRCAPAGVFRLGPSFGSENWREVTATGAPFRVITPTLEAVDDPKSRFYNRIVDRSQIRKPDWRSSEKMATVPDYAGGIVIGHNPNNVPNAGSCIFLHLWLGERRGSAGCTVLRESDLRRLFRWLELAAQPLLVQLPREEALRFGFNP